MSFMPTIETGDIMSYANTVVTNILPYLYILAGISVGFAIVSRITSAFKRN